MWIFWTWNIDSRTLWKIFCSLDASCPQLVFRTPSLLVKHKHPPSAYFPSHPILKHSKTLYLYTDLKYGFWIHIYSFNLFHQNMTFVHLQHVATTIGQWPHNQIVAHVLLRDAQNSGSETVEVFYERLQTATNPDSGPLFFNQITCSALLSAQNTSPASLASKPLVE